MKRGVATVLTSRFVGLRKIMPKRLDGEPNYWRQRILGVALSEK
jgi:hypothetical protein